MSFLTPLFLLGAAAVAVPVVLHLTQRSRSNVVPFPSIMFLRRVPFRTTRRRRIRHPLLLLLRSLAILLLAAAFARPFLDTDSAVGDRAGEAREIVLLLDRSYSMQYGDTWERAVAAARETLAAVGIDDRVSLVSFADRAEALTRSSADQAALESALSAAAPGYGITRYDPALRLAARILAESELPRREIVLITDFQRAGWPEPTRVPVPDGVTVVPLDVAAAQPSNVSVTDLTFAREAASGRDRFAAAARLSNLGQEAVPDLEVTLSLGGKRVASRRVDLEPRGSTTVRFSAIAVPAAITRGEVRISPDALAVDDVRYFVLSPNDVLDVLIVQEAGRADRSLFLRQALAIGEQPPMRVEVTTETRLSASDLAGRDLVVLNDVASPTGTVGGALREWTEAGGGLVVALGRRAGPERWPEAAAGLLPVEVGDVRDRTTDGGGVIAFLDYDHPALGLFSAPRSGDFSEARFYRYRRLAPVPSARVLARFDDGEAALVEGRVGDGRVVVWASTLDRLWNDLALQPVFLPLVQQLVREAAGYEERRRWHEVGDLVDVRRLVEEASTGGRASAASSLAAGEAASEDGWVLISPSGEHAQASSAGEGQEAGAGLSELTEPGYYVARRLESSDTGVPIAVNPALEESDLTTLDADEFAAVALSTGAGAAEEAAALAGDALADPAGPARTGREVWWFLLLGAAALLVIETLLSNRLSRARAVVPGTRVNERDGRARAR